MVVRTIDGFRFLIDPNDPARQPSGVTISHMSPEEIEAKYGKPKAVNKKYLNAYFDSTEVKGIRRREKNGNSKK